jgi:hypothetical protein
MTKKSDSSRQDWHRQFAVDLFNRVWELLEKEERTDDENIRMLHAAHASRFHWGEIGTSLEIERGEWQVSRVYSVLNHPQPAIYHAELCLEICKSHGIGDFDLAFAYEALSRAYTVAGDFKKSQEYIELGKQAGSQITDNEDQEYFFRELQSVAELGE